ncbi:nickel-responsive transcriptional regulator NikR [Isosphaeraceae bacterium EP7]
MSDIVRFSVSLEADLLARFDDYCRDQSLPTRSEAIRQLLHERLNRHVWQGDARDAVATLTLVYDHHRPQVSERLRDIQHERVDRVVSTLHVHLDHDRCLEVIILRGPAGELQELSTRLKALKGIQVGEITVASASQQDQGTDGADDAGDSHGHGHSHGHAHPHEH